MNAVPKQRNPRKLIYVRIQENGKQYRTNDRGKGKGGQRQSICQSTVLRYMHWVCIMGHVTAGLR